MCLIPKMTHNINANIPKCKKFQNTKLHLSQTFLVRDTNLYETLDGIKLRDKQENGAKGWSLALKGTVSVEKMAQPLMHLDGDGYMCEYPLPPVCFVLCA